MPGLCEEASQNIYASIHEGVQKTMNESGVWQYIRKGMQGMCLMTRIESSAGNGVPDVIIHHDNGHSFLELKYIKEWPKRPGTKVKLPLRPEQKLWITSRGALSGNVWVLFRIQDDYFLLSWALCEHASAGWTQADWKNDLYCLYWPKKIFFQELYLAIKENRI